MNGLELSLGGYKRTKVTGSLGGEKEWRRKEGWSENRRERVQGRRSSCTRQTGSEALYTKLSEESSASETAWRSAASRRAPCLHPASSPRAEPAGLLQHVNAVEGGRGPVATTSPPPAAPAAAIGTLGDLFFDAGDLERRWNRCTSGIGACARRRWPAAQDWTAARNQLAVDVVLLAVGAGSHWHPLAPTGTRCHRPGASRAARQGSPLLSWTG